ncbi:CDP-glycerol glycerophosphotransferase family protein [Lactococcus petauri]|uniref:CDP-glycerol glycerophosphotransferase family protein n=1 Tax=Lactococcus petauri TaxID=1940789 RepID=UPI003854686C
MYNDFAFETEVDDRPVTPQYPEEAGYVVLKDSVQENVYRCYKNGLYEKFKWYDDAGKLIFIDYLFPSFIREKREWYDSKGYIKKVEYMDPTTNKPIRVTYLNKSGNCYLSSSLNPTTGKTNQILWFGKNGEFKASFKNEDDMLLYWLKNIIITNEVEYSYLISEYHFKKHVLSQIKKDYLSIIYAFHSSHYKPFTSDGSIKPEHIKFLQNLEEIEAVVFLTKEQREDIIAEFGNSYKVHAISHYAEKVIVNDKKRDSKIVVALARFAPLKNLDHAIKAFKRVIKTVPEAKLEIYGRGPEEKNLKRLIKENNLSNNVFINGFTSNSYKVFEKAAISVVPSDHEGQGLSLMESMTSGCPVISYDFKYGPNDMMQNGINGVIVPHGDIKALACNIIDLLTDDEKRSSMSNEAKKITDNFSEERLIREWNELFNKLRNKKETLAGKRVTEVKDNYFFIESFHGKNFSGDPKHLALAISEKYPEAKIFVSSTNQLVDKTIRSYGFETLRTGSKAYLETFALCKYIFINGNSLDRAGKSEKQIIIQTWHGFPIKKMVADLEDMQQREKELTAFIPRMKKWDYLLTSSDFHRKLLNSSFQLSKNNNLKILNFGTPKNGYLIENKESIQEKEKIHLKYLNKPLDKDKKYILFCPTWRKNERSEVTSIDLKEVINQLPENYEIIVKLHPHEAQLRRAYSNLDARIHCFYNELVDIQELYLLSSILISDYSSAVFDYAHLHKKIILLQEDIEEYTHQIGMYFDSGSLLHLKGKNYTTEELVENILSSDEDEKYEYNSLIVKELLNKDSIHSANDILKEIGL